VSDVDNWDTFSFNNVASMLGINPVYVREGMLAWRDAERTRKRTRILAESMQEMTLARLSSAAEPEYAPMQATA
ncbi:MAG: hypothetical protein ABGY28_01775, partial [bacterium]